MRRLLRFTAAALTTSILSFAGPAPALADPVRDAQWHLGFLNISATHAQTQGNGVIVGVLDTGVDADHPDLAGSVLPGRDFTGNETDGSEDLQGHGTGMAGLIAGHGRILGIAPAARILPVRTAVLLSDFGSPVGAIDWAVQNGARVLCLAYAHRNSQEVRKEVERAIAADVVIVAAAGNVPDGDKPGQVFPAGYPGVVGAAGVDRNGNHAAVSLVSSSAVLAAPAVDVASTDIRTEGHTGYRSGTGTSDSTAIIAGAAALVRAKYPNLSATEVIRRLTATADDKGAPGRDDEYGYGVINIVKALTADLAPPTASATPVPTDTRAAPPRADDGSPTKTVIIVSAIVLGALLLVGGVVVFRRQHHD